MCSISLCLTLVPWCSPEADSEHHPFARRSQDLCSYWQFEPGAHCLCVCCSLWSAGRRDFLQWRQLWPCEVRFCCVLFTMSARSNPYLVVTYGPPSRPTAFPVLVFLVLTQLTLPQCSILAGTNDTVIVCRTQAASGSNLVFRAQTGPPGAIEAGIGSDTYSYPVSPQLVSVSGCHDGLSRFCFGSLY